MPKFPHCGCQFEGGSEDFRRNGGKIAENRALTDVNRHYFSANRGLPLPLGRGVCGTNPKMGVPIPENALFLGFSVLRGGLRPWSEEGVGPWGRGRSGDCQFRGS